MKTPEQILPLEKASYPNGYSGFVVGYDLAIEKMKEYAEQLKPIPVEKELPPIGKRILIFYNDGCCDFGFLSSVFHEPVKDFIGNIELKIRGNWSHGRDGKNKPFGFSDFMVTHWMHVPDVRSIKQH